MGNPRSLRKTLTSTAKGLVILSIGLLLFGWLLNTPPGLLGKADAIGYAVCHRIDLRSFHLGDRQLPLCVRCSGMYLGAMLGLAYQALTRPRAGGFPQRSVWVVYASFCPGLCRGWPELLSAPFSRLHRPVRAATLAAPADRHRHGAGGGRACSTRPSTRPSGRTGRTSRP